MLHGSKLILFVLIIAIFAAPKGSDTVRIDAFSYVPSPDGNSLALLMYYDRPDDLGEPNETPTGGFGIYSITEKKLDSIKTPFALYYVTDKDGMWWRGENAVLFSSFIATGKQYVAWIYKDELMPTVFKWHMVEQSAPSPGGKQIAFWQYLQDNCQQNYPYSLMIKTANIDKLDTVCSAQPNSLDPNRSILLYQIQWQTDSGFLFGLVEGKGKKFTAVLKSYDIPTKQIGVIDTLDKCFYRSYKGCVYYGKNRKLWQRNVSTHALRKVADSVDGEFDVSDSGIVFCQGKKIYSLKGDNNRPTMLCIGGFAPRWLGNRNAIVYSIVDKTRKARTKMVIKELK